MPRRPAYSEQQLRAAIADSVCWSDVLRRLGRRTAGGNHRVVRQYAARWDIPTDHFDPGVGRRRAGESRQASLDDVLVERSTYDRGTLKRRLFAEGLRERRCEMCGQDERWNGRRMSLILDHINGISDDNRLENLQVVCPNCAATLDTHCGRNPVLHEPRECLACGCLFLPGSTQQRYCSLVCVGAVKSEATKGVPRPELRKAERPPYEQLLREIEATGYVAVGRRYGVSDNAVRKWMRSYERSG